MINNKGSTLTNWVFIILMISLFLVLFQGEVLNPMNTMYGKNLSVGLSSDSSDTIDSISSTASSSSGDIDDAEVSTLDDGVTIVEVGAIAKRTFGTIWDFASGRFISVLIVDQLDMPDAVATVIQVLIWMSLIFIIMRIFMRGVTP
jgi:hypothetical protein